MIGKALLSPKGEEECFHIVVSFFLQQTFHQIPLSFFPFYVDTFGLLSLPCLIFLAFCGRLYHS